MLAYGLNQTVYPKPTRWGDLFRAATTFAEALTGAEKSVAWW